jgi:hypothetical protein
VLERSKMVKIIRWDVLDGRLSWSFDQDEIVAEKLFDGCYIVSGEVPFLTHRKKSFDLEMRFVIFKGRLQNFGVLHGVG